MYTLSHDRERRSGELGEGKRGERERGGKEEGRERDFLLVRKCDGAIHIIKACFARIN